MLVSWEFMCTVSNIIFYKIKKRLLISTLNNQKLLSFLRRKAKISYRAVKVLKDLEAKCINEITNFEAIPRINLDPEDYEDMEDFLDKF